MTDQAMTYLFSTAGLAALHEFTDTSTLFAFDLDGTLAPIIADPQKIVIEEELRRSLIRLNSLAPVAIITGRSCVDARSHLGFSPRFLAGNHGAEGLPGMEGSSLDCVRICQQWKDQLLQMLPDMFSHGIALEAKGETLALHYRNAADPLHAREEIMAAIGRLQPLSRVVTGIFVLNLAPIGAHHKGEALEILMKQAGCDRALFVGDDVTDEDVYHLKNPAVFGIRVGKYPESAARYYLEKQDEMLRLLHTILCYFADERRLNGEKFGS